MNTTTLTDKTIGEIAAEIPAAIRIFEQYHIDYCCGGRTPLPEACATAGITIDEFQRAIETSTAAPQAGLDWSTRTLADLSAYLVSRFHMHAREELQTIGLLAAKVVSVHGSRHPELQRVASLADALTADMLPHMMKEERVLFPYVEQLESGDCGGGSCFGTVANPIRVMMMEHESVGAILADLRQTTSGYALPADACFSYRELYRRLEEFERETHEHIHLENNVYFPRALAIETKA